jgi:hypothetical protein
MSVRIKERLMEGYRRVRNSARLDNNDTLYELNGGDLHTSADGRRPNKLLDVSFALWQHIPLLAYGLRFVDLSHKVISDFVNSGNRRLTMSGKGAGRQSLNTE